ncbi:MAG: hypothetical protein MUC51_12770 [Anaerolineae bacterium]|jgi:uncharacterized repeat protein (TIGR01451 family)|nr:hypothetical protein [Anaerolineae bacterium]
MRRNYRLAGYLLAAAVLVGLMASGPQAWATPDQISSQQTVPTRTPKPPDREQEPPTATPIITPTAAVATTSPTVKAAGTPIPMATPTPTATGVPLSLTVRANPSRVWRGMPVEYTLTLVNRSASPIRNVILLDALPAMLEPGGIISGAGATWQDRTLRIEKDELKPGERLEVIFQAIVAENLPAGTTIANQADASAAGGLQAKANVAVVSPPAELPRVGGSCDADR